MDRGSKLWRRPGWNIVAIQAEQIILLGKRAMGIFRGPNWYKQRKRALERDGFECQMPDCFVDREIHRERWDRDLHVHHITPLGTFIDADNVLDYKRSNRLENLITLCQRHHMLWEEFVPLQFDLR